MFIYELPNLKANTITRYTNNTGFIVTIRSTPTIIFKDNKNVTMNLRIMRADN